MIVEKARLSLEDNEARIVALVRSEAGHFPPFELVLGVPRMYVGWLDLSGNLFVPTLLLLAGVVGERLCLEGAVAPLLLRGGAAASELFRLWWGIAPAAIEAETDLKERPAGGGTALFFTRGVDSWHSALRGTNGDWPERLTHLLYAPDLDRQNTPPTRRRVLRLTSEAAGCLGLPLIPISFNGRELLDPFVNWERSHGGVLAGIGLGLGGGIANLVIASSYDHGHLIPWGSHPALDPLWSTERTAVRIDGLEVTRTDKVKAIAASPVARLKVCWQVDTEANCGYCDKCIRTQLALAITGALERAGVFLRPLTVEAINALPPPVHESQPGRHDPLWVELCESFPDEPALASLRAAAFGRLPPWHPLVTSSQARTGAVIALEVPPGAAVSLLPAAVSDLLPGPVAVRDGRPVPAAGGGAVRVEITWTAPAPGTIAFPLRPPAALLLDFLDACRTTVERPIPWCLMARPGPEAACLMARLTESWGPGVACLTPGNEESGDHGVPRSEAAAIQQRSAVRVWWGGGDYLDPFVVLEALRHGCLPLQCGTEAAHEALMDCLPPGLAQFALAVPSDGKVSQISATERAARLDGGLSSLLAGSLERDLVHLLHRIERGPR